ncbi:hypothetical protein M408DRAFT_332090 [Serendipita vermifera MAFF 305830]|uniref:F-box domain-containing protein n=1 Tax=Serendipita vermifera MAFF 305830 TaxID=933852 RepID=A0A0C3AV43_SERVB|nr:hypothetical protein M408DRAFT_332090 [Serendipita vermifera MAFF 305830]
MLTNLPPEILHEIVVLACPLIRLSYDPKTPTIRNSFEVSPPAAAARIAQTCSVLNTRVEYTTNALLFARIFERTFDFDAARRRLGTEWAGPHGLAWEGKRRWVTIKRIKAAVATWECDECKSLSWLDFYGEEDILSDLWTVYFMLLENDGRNAILLLHGASLGSYVEMLCGLFFGRRLVGRVGWPRETQERALLAWILCAWDPMPGDFYDQDLYHQTKLSMRAFAFGSFKYSLGILPPTYFHHPSRRNPSHYNHQPSPISEEPYPLTTSSSSSRYTAWITPLKPPIYKYSADPLVPVPLYARTIWVYQPSMAVAALLWYFRGVDEASDGQSDTEEQHHHKTSPDSINSGQNPVTQSTTTNNSSPFARSSMSSYFSPVQTQTRGWTTPVLFAPPVAATGEEAYQAVMNKRYRNELYMRGFNAPSRQLETEWVRRLEGQMRFNGPNPNPITGFVPGSLEGTWEGGFVYLDFPDYAQFLTGEREADADFYSLPADKLYGVNRQVWKLKEYELPVNPSEYTSSSMGNSAASGSLGRQSNYRPTRGSTIESTQGPTSMSSSSSSSCYEPLTEGKWRDGWLPPAESLQWRLPDDCGDELEIVETVPVDVELQNMRTGALTESTHGSFSSSSMGGDDEDSVGWEKEKLGVSNRVAGPAGLAGFTGRASYAVGPGPPRDADTASVTPIGLKNSREIEGPAPKEIPARMLVADPTSPRSPEFDTTLMPGMSGFGGRRRESGVDEYSFGNVGGTRRSTMDTDAPVSSEGGHKRVVEKVSRYIRWDPHVAWAKQAIWGAASGTSGGASVHGKTRGGGGHPGHPAVVPKVRRQIRDILIFGESHSSWGEATIRGRVRSHDGLITLVKNYPQRATWIYTGYMVGGESFVGRWRDADSPDEINGYEGPFAMKRRPRV